MGAVFKRRRTFHIANIVVFSICVLISFIAIALTDRFIIELWNFGLVLIDSSMLTYHIIKLKELNRCAKDLRDLALQVLSSKDEG